MKFDIFEKPGIANTNNTFENAVANAKILGIKKIVIASTYGDTIKKSLEYFDPQEYKLIGVTHNFGFKENHDQTFPNELRTELEGKGIDIITGTLAFSGVGSSLIRKYQQYDATTMFSRLIRTIICDGVKVCMEIALMAVDAGKVDVGEKILNIAGSGRGADTCCYISASSSRLFEKMRLHAILAKPQ